MSEWNVMSPFRERTGTGLLLYLERPPAYFTETDGNVRQYQGDFPEILQRPIVISNNGSLKGKVSGARSGLVLDSNGVMYRIKGCRPSKEDYLDQPRGGQTLDYAMGEISLMEKAYAILEREGVKPVSIPLALYLYRMTFKRKTCVATVFKVRGDTRFDEFLGFMEQYLLGSEAMYSEPVPVIQSLGELSYKVGVVVGSMLRVINDHDITWNRKVIEHGNAHLGNIVLFEHVPEETMLGMVDFDASTKWLQKEPMDEVRINDIKNLTEHMMEADVSSHRVKMPLPENRENLVTPYRERYRQGFDAGYEKPQIGPIQTSEFSQASRDFWIAHVRYHSKHRSRISHDEALERLRESLAH